MGFLRLGLWIAFLGVPAFAPPIVAGRLIPTEPGKPLSPGKFIAPNEHRFELYGPVLNRRGGTLVSVGGLRTDLHFGLGQFDDLVRVDYDPAIAAFNEARDKLLLESKDRWDYLARLIVRDPDPKLVELARSGKLDPVFLMDRLQYVAAKDAQQPLREIQDPIAEALARAYGEPELRTDRISVRYRLVQEMRQLLNQARGMPSFLKSDEAFARLRTSVREQRTATVTGSVSSEVVMAPIARALTDGKRPVSVVDISNLMEHFPGTRAADLRQMAANFRKLPLSADAVVLFTVDVRREPLRSKLNPWKNSDPLVYFSLPAGEFLDLVEAGQFDRDQYEPTLVALGKKFRSAELAAGILSVPTASEGCSPWLRWLNPRRWISGK